VTGKHERGEICYGLGETFFHSKERNKIEKAYQGGRKKRGGRVVHLMNQGGLRRKRKGINAT